MTYYAKRTDANHKEIVNAFKDLGCSIFDTSRIGMGFPDVIIGKNGKTVLVEIKSSEKAKFTTAQDLFMMNWKGSTVCRVHDLEGVKTVVKVLDNASE